MSQKLPLVVIVGETASGKSSLAMLLAQELDGEIICADSRTIYKGMDIGTAKPTKAEQKQVPHHLLDVVEPDAMFTAADFKRLALEVIADIRSRNMLPLMVGGTGLYVDAVVFDYQFRAKYDDKIRSSLEKKSLEQLLEVAVELGLESSDLSSNRRHLIRLIESGPSSQNDRQQIMSDCLIVGLRVARAELRRRIKQRVERMFRAGLRKEVDELAAKFGWQHEALTGIGYKEFEDYSKGVSSMSAVKREIEKHTLAYAKRQRTWFKRNPAITWFDDPELAHNFVHERLKTNK